MSGPTALAGVPFREQVGAPVPGQDGPFASPPGYARHETMPEGEPAGDGVSGPLGPITWRTHPRHLDSQAKATRAERCIRCLCVCGIKRRTARWTGTRSGRVVVNDATARVIEDSIAASSS